MSVLFSQSKSTIVHRFGTTEENNSGYFDEMQLLDRCARARTIADNFDVLHHAQIRVEKNVAM